MLCDEHWPLHLIDRAAIRSHHNKYMMVTECLKIVLAVVYQCCNVFDKVCVKIIQNLQWMPL